MTNDKKRHATVSAIDGVNYRDIAAVMTELGFPMYHSSARNNVINAMCEFVRQLADHYDIRLSEEEIIARAKSPEFQSIIGQILNRSADERAVALKNS